MRRKIVFASLAILVLLSLLVVPTGSWTYPDCTEDTRYEKFGPRADRLLIKLYADEIAEFTAFELCEIDMVDWHLPKRYIVKWSEPPYNETIKVVPAGAELGMYVIDINNNPNELLGNPAGYGPTGEWHGTPNPVYPNPCGVSSFRHALAHCMDRRAVIDYCEDGLGYPMYTMVPPSCPNYVHPDIRPGGALENLTHPHDKTEAARLLDENKFPIGPDGWRYWDRNCNGVKDANEDLELIFYIRSDQQFENCLGDLFADQLEAPPIQIQVDRRYGDQYYCWKHVMLEHNFHLYTGYWRMPEDPYLLLENPTHLHTLYHIDKYWYPGFCPNYNAVNCSDYNYWVEELIQANTYADAKYAAYKAQEEFATPCCIGKIPVKCADVYKAYKRCYSGGTDGALVIPDDGENKYRCQRWKGVVNKPGFGIDNEYSFLNMYPEGHLMGDCENMTIRWGFKTCHLKLLNPLYASAPHDWNVLHLIYESLLTRDPYTYEFIPSKAKAFEVGTWKDPMTHEIKSKVRFTLRTDDCWHDGVPFSAADVKFTLCELPRLLNDAGLPPPWWIDNVRHVIDCCIIDPCNIEILLDIKSVWAVKWTGLNIILPKHVWLPIIESYKATGRPDPTGFSPDPDLIGNGPWRLKDYVPCNYILLLANKPSLTITTNLENDLGPAKPVHNPCGYRDRCPSHVNVHSLEEWHNKDPIIDEKWECTQWHYKKGEHGYICTQWHLDYWEDSNGNGILDQCDYIYMTMKRDHEPVGPTIVRHVFYVEKRGHVMTDVWPPCNVTIWTDWYSQRIYPCDKAAFGIDIHNQWCNPHPNTAGAPCTGELVVNKIVKLSIEQVIPGVSGTTFPPCQWLHFQEPTEVHLQDGALIHFLTEGEIIVDGVTQHVVPSEVRQFPPCTQIWFPPCMEIHIEERPADFHFKLPGVIHFKEQAVIHFKTPGIIIVNGEPVEVLNCTRMHVMPCTVIEFPPSMKINIIERQTEIHFVYPTEIHLQKKLVIHFKNEGTIVVNGEPVRVEPCDIIEFPPSTQIWFPECMQINIEPGASFHWKHPTEVQILPTEIIVLPYCEHHKEIINLHFKKCHYNIKVALHIKGPEEFQVTKGRWKDHVVDHLDNDGDECISVCDNIILASDPGTWYHVDQLGPEPLPCIYGCVDLYDKFHLEYVSGPGGIYDCWWLVVAAHQDTDGDCIIDVCEPIELERSIHVPNPWICTWQNYTWHFWSTIREDISGKWWDTWHGKNYPVPGCVGEYYVPNEVPTPDCVVRIDDVLTAALAFGSQPGHPRWNCIADVNGDYKVRIDDVLAIALKFGWTC